MKCTKLLCAALAVLCWTTSVHAAILVNDTWLDGNRTDPAAPTYSENGTDLDSDNDLESVWYRSGEGTLAPVGPGGPLRGDMLGDATPVATSSASWTTYFTPQGSEVTLANPGDSIKVTWVFTTGDVNATNTSQAMRFALIDSATFLAADGTPSGSATGYAMFINMGETLGHSNSYNLRGRTANSAILSSSGDWGTNIANSGVANDPGYTDNTQYTMVWTVTRNANGNHDISVSMNGGTLGPGNAGLLTIASDIAPNGGSHKFDTFTLRPSRADQTATVFDTSLFKVEFSSVPEPTSLGLLGLSALAMVLRRQR